MTGAPRSNCTIHLRVTNPALRCQSLKGVWCRWLDLHQLPAHYQCAAHLDVLQRRFGTHGVSRTLATRLRRAGAEFRRRGCDMAPVSGVEPLRSAFVVRSPKSLGPRAKWLWRVDLHHHRQVYETCAPLFVLRHSRQDGASRSARTFVSSSSGKRLNCLSYRGEIGTPGQS